MAITSIYESLLQVAVEIDTTQEYHEYKEEVNDLNDDLEFVIKGENEE